MNEFVYAPVLARLWQQHEVWDGTYSLDDLFDAHELLAVESENKNRSYEASKQKRD